MCGHMSLRIPAAASWLLIHSWSNFNQHTLFSCGQPLRHRYRIDDITELTILSDVTCHKGVLRTVQHLFLHWALDVTMTVCSVPGHCRLDCKIATEDACPLNKSREE